MTAKELKAILDTFDEDDNVFARAYTGNMGTSEFQINDVVMRDCAICLDMTIERIEYE